MRDLTEISKEMSYLLRHKPEKKNLILDTEGYTDVNDLLKALDITKSILDTIVKTDHKQRYSYNIDGTKIRANQGHSLSYVNIKYKEFIPKDKLYHGTSQRFVTSISKNGLKPQTRNYVHISQDINTAKEVGLRHAKTLADLIIYEIDYKSMLDDGYKFFISDNNVVLTKEVPPKYLKIAQVVLKCDKINIS